jgi:hypothetical protein
MLSLSSASLGHLSDGMDLLYSSLDDARREIRVINLQPGTWDDIIVCTLQVVSLDDSPTYSTLSYVWGDRPQLIE